MINSAPIGSQSSLNAGGSRRSQDLVLKSLSCFTIQSRVKKREENTSVFKEELLQEMRAV